MKKVLLSLAVLTALMGCGKIDRMTAAWAGDGTKTCVDGVTYLQFTSGATLQVDRTGKPVPCGK
jgi:uncharacterized protein YceK